MAEGSIHQQALSIARQVELYLEAHPEMLTVPAKELEANKELAALAVQPVGKTGYTALYDSDAVTHFHTNPALIGADLHTLASTLPEFWRIMETSLSGIPVDGYYRWKEADGSLRDKYMSCVPVGKTRFRVAATTYIDEFSQPIQNTRAKITGISQETQRQLMGVLGMTGGIAVLVAVFLAAIMIRPLGRITEGTRLLSQGQLDHEIRVDSKDEIGQLAAAFNQMVRELKRALQEKDDAARQLERRVTQVATSAEISHAASLVLDPDELLRQVVELIRKRFDLYYVAVFLMDESGGQAMLHADTGEAGQTMLGHGHKLPVGETSMVGWACAHKEARIALDMGEEAVRFANPLLPETRSEIALPLRAGERVLGALDIQSVQARAFDENDITVLQGMADQIAVALENARLFQQAQASVKEVERVNRLLTRQGWETFLRSAPIDFAEFHQGDAAPFTPEETDRLELSEGQTDQTGVVCVPLTVRDQVIGTLIVEQSTDQSNSLEAVGRSAAGFDLLEPIATQAAQAMENARLFEDTQRRAAREQVVNRLTARFAHSLDIDTVLQTVVRELGESLSVREVSVLVGSPATPSPVPTSED
jgi:GAF domain-containing protein/HAMP domain-containing protein